VPKDVIERATAEATQKNLSPVADYYTEARVSIVVCRAARNPSILHFPHTLQPTK